MGRVVDMAAGGAVDVWVARMAEVMAVWAVEVWVAMANGGRDTRWVHNIATSCGFLPHDGRPRSRQSAIIDNSKAIFRSMDSSLLVGEDIVVERPKAKGLGWSQQ